MRLRLKIISQLKISLNCHIAIFCCFAIQHSAEVVKWLLRLSFYGSEVAEKVSANIQQLNTPLNGNPLAESTLKPMCRSPPHQLACSEPFLLKR
jgi:hypothetical protein